MHKTHETIFQANAFSIPLKMAKGRRAQNTAPNAENVRSCILKLSGALKPSFDLLKPISIAEKPTMPKATSAITCKALKSGSMIFKFYPFLPVKTKVPAQSLD